MIAPTQGGWSGYVVVGGHYTEVSASWVQPRVNCADSPTSYSEFWVGLDGQAPDDHTVEQIGTEGRCFHGSHRYEAWYDAWPKRGRDSAKRVKPGDRIYASVTADGNAHFTFVVADRSQGWTDRSSAMMANARLASAEVIVEDPYFRLGHPVKLANFGAVSFTGATVNRRAFSQGLTGIYRLTMGFGGKAKARTSALTNGAFTVKWTHS